MENQKTKNKGEWSEIYIFFKLLTDGKVYMADKDMHKLKDVFLDVISIIREEVKDQEYRYYPGEKVKITLNGTEVKDVDRQLIIDKMNRLWDEITSSPSGFTDEDMVRFLKELCITKIAAPSKRSNSYFGGTADIIIQTKDFRSGVVREIGFSEKSDIKATATLTNASKDNTNFVYEVLGADDALMEQFNTCFDSQGHVATRARMNMLHEAGAALSFVKPASLTAAKNLTKAGGADTSKLVAGLLEYYYFQRNDRNTSLKRAVEWIAEHDYLDYKSNGWEDSELYDTYRTQVGNLLYHLFTGMKLGSVWNGRDEVSGGYIVVKKDGEVVAVHSSIADEFKDYLFENMNMEAPSCSRHDYMKIYKEDGKYFLKFALQLRFKPLASDKD